MRGIQVSTGPGVENKNKEETEQSEQVQYQTVNRIFAKMCKSAEANPTEPYVLIIDEMNRANLPSVLGELIYGLEYRGEKVQTPYEVNGSNALVVPENLFVIGTMNTADRSIGHIDYAIRRRFAFIDVLPDSTVIKDQKAGNYFKVVENVFKKHLNSNDYQQNHVQIGHSYFLPNKGNEFSEGELELKMEYEVLPILREYVNDGILNDSEDKLLKALNSWESLESFIESESKPAS